MALTYPHELREEVQEIQSDRGSTCMLSSDLMVATTLPSEYREDSMHAMSLLEKWLQRNAVIGHRGRIQALVRVVGALLDGWQARVDAAGPSPARWCVCEAPHQGGGPTAGQPAPSWGTTRGL